MAAFNDIINSDQPTLVDFSAEWCGPCKTLAPVLSEVSKQVQGKVRIIKVDIDKNPQAASHFNIRSVPTLLLFKKGKVLWQQTGVLPAKQLLDVIGKFT
jgi:thioredoxin 1